MDATFTLIHWPLPRPVTLVIAESCSHTLTGVSPSTPARSRALQLREQHPIRYNVYTPHLYHVTMTDLVWANPFSLAATNGISIDFFSSSYSDASLRTVRPPRRKQGSVKRDLIRRSWDLRSHAPTPGLSQLATSFITYQAESSTNRRLCTSFLLVAVNYFLMP